MDVLDGGQLQWDPFYKATMSMQTYSAIPLAAAVEHDTTNAFLSKSPLSMFAKPNRRISPLLTVFIIFLAAIVTIENCVERTPIVLMSSKENILRNSTLSAPSTDVLRFMTLNAFIRPIGVGIGDYKDNRLHDLLQRVGSFDIICFQELFTSSGFRKVKFLRKLEQLYGFHSYVTSPSPGIQGLFSFPPKIIDGGLVIATRYDILQADYRTYSRANIQSIDFIVAKGVLYARVALPVFNTSNCIIHVFTTHMQANNGLDVDFATTRQSQLEELVEFVVEKTSDAPGDPLILAGDFNVDGRQDFNNGSSSIEYLQMMKVLKKVRRASPLRDILYDACGDAHPVTSAGGLLGDQQKNERLDYVFFSAGDKNETHSQCTVRDIADSVRVEPWKISERPYRTLSDHWAVVANFSMEPSDNGSRNR